MSELRENTLRFLERGFRNIDLPPLSEDDLRDIGEALDATRHPPTPLISDENVERVARAMFEAWPIRAVSPALASKAAVPIGTALTWDAVLEMGGDHNGLLRLARAALQAISTSTENEK